MFVLNNFFFSNASISFIYILSKGNDLEMSVLEYIFPICFSQTMQYMHLSSVSMYNFVSAETFKLVEKKKKKNKVI